MILSCLFYLLSINPGVLAKVFVESASVVLEIFKKKPPQTIAIPGMKLLFFMSYW